MNLAEQERREGIACFAAEVVARGIVTGRLQVIECELATLIGNGPDSLTKVQMIGNDMALDPGIGTCGKSGQGVPVGNGSPTIRIARMTVGGTGGAGG